MASKKTVSVRLDGPVLKAIDKLALRHERSREGEIRWLLSESVRQLELKTTAEWRTRTRRQPPAAAKDGEA